MSAEIIMLPSVAIPGALKVLIVSERRQEVQEAIDALRGRWGHVEFLVPALCADEKWAAFGRVSGLVVRLQ